MRQAMGPIAPCVHRDVCGGCAFQGIPYPDQLEAKRSAAASHLAGPAAALAADLAMEAAPDQYRYRNKMEYTFGDEVKGGPMTLGLHRKGHYMSVVTTDRCQLVDEDFNRIQAATLAFCGEKGYTTYHKKTHRGLLRHLVLRKGEATQQILVNLVVSDPAAFDGNGYADRLRSLDLDNSLAGILLTGNDAPADAVQCQSLDVLAGNDWFEEEVAGLRFRISPLSFFQTNTKAAGRLYEEALGQLDIKAGMTVFDLYSGTGTIAQLLAAAGARVIGVELVGEAVEAATANAARNGLADCRFLQGDVLEVLDRIQELPDAIVVDPPRAGIHPKALEKILNYGIKQILYISCNPKTLAIDLTVAREKGYRAVWLKAYDNFPFTSHTECAALLQKE